MLVSLSGSRRWWLVVASLFLAVPLLLAAARTWLADTWARSDSPASWQRAAEFEPANAEHWRRLGRYRQWDFENADLRRAAEHFERAVHLNPESAFLRMDLASAYEMQGEGKRARDEFEQAKRLYPISSDVAWNYGNFLLRAGDLPAAFAEIRRAVDQAPSLVPLAVSVCWRGGADVQRILNEVLPPRTASHLAAVEFFLAEKQYDAALRVWGRIENSREPLDRSRALPLVDLLLDGRRVAEADRVWRRAFGVSSESTSLLWDGGFEENPTNGGFGWRHAEPRGARVDFERAEPRSGQAALRLRFDGSANLDLSAPYQYVAVQPGTRYRFSAFVKLNEITTDSGMRFQIFDPWKPGEVLAETPNLTGTLPWTEQSAEFTTGAETRLLRVGLRRNPSTKFDSKIRGRAWVDDASLVSIPPGGARR